MLITESMHLSDATLVGEKWVPLPKGYLYFAIAFFVSGGNAKHANE